MIESFFVFNTLRKKPRFMVFLLHQQGQKFVECLTDLSYFRASPKLLAEVGGVFFCNYQCRNSRFSDLQLPWKAKWCWLNETGSTKTKVRLRCLFAGWTVFANPSEQADWVHSGGHFHDHPLCNFDGKHLFGCCRWIELGLLQLNKRIELDLLSFFIQIITSVAAYITILTDLGNSESNCAYAYEMLNNTMKNS